MDCPFCQAPNADDEENCFQCGRLLSGITRGTVLAGRYEVLGRLGKGGMGTVYKAHDRALEEDVAVKVLRAEFAKDADGARRFRSEIKLARKVAHRNVCRIHDWGEDGPLQFISMQYVDGVNLHQVIRQAGPLPTEEAFATAIAIAEGLDAIHREGIVHRDIKTANIMRDRTGAVRLMDFGIAKEWGARSLTTTGQTLGTPEYMSPEQIEGGAVDARSDLYALGVVVFELFTGTVPFKGNTPAAVILKHLKEPPPLEDGEAQALPRPLVPVLARMLAKEPVARYGSAREVLAALESARRETKARPPARATRPATDGVAQQPTVTTPVAVPETPPTVRREAPLPAPAMPTSTARRLWLTGGVAAIAVAAGFLGVRSFNAPLESPPGVASPAAEPPPTTLAAAVEGVGKDSRDASAPPIAGGPAGRAEPPEPRRLRSVGSTAEGPSPPPTPLEPDEGPTKPLEDGLLKVGALPWGEVAVDGTRIGTTPMAPFTIASGTHTVRLTHPDYQPLVRVVDVRPGETSRVFADFTSEGSRRDE